MRGNRRQLSRKVDSSATNFKITTPNLRKTTHNDSLDLQDEPLDFEPEDEFTDNHSSVKENYLQNSYNGSDKFYSNSTDALEEHSSISHTGIKGSSFISDSSREATSCATEELGSISSASHRSYMIQYDQRLNRAEDGRQNEYLQYVPPSSNVPLMVNSSSSSSGFSGGHTNHDDMDDDDESIHSSLAEYDMSSDEENRLLESDDEKIKNSKNYDSIELNEGEETEEIIEEEENEEEDAGSVICEEIESTTPIFQDKTLKKQGLNNIIITIRSENSNEQSDKLVERSGPCAIQENKMNQPIRKLKIRREKRFYMPRSKKWIRYEPYSTRLFLEDIGYIPKYANSNYSTSSGSEKSFKSIQSVQVTIKSTNSNEDRRCEQIEKSISQAPAFKIPLPPTKRPPTRPKRSESFSSTESMGSSNSNRSLGRMIVTAPKEDDVISISASSIDPLDNESVDVIKDETSSQFDMKNDGISNYSEPYHHNRYVEDWISNQSREPKLPLLQLPQIAFGEHEPNFKIVGSTITQGLNSEPLPLLQHQTSSSTPLVEQEPSFRILGSTTLKGGPRIKFSDIPKFFHGICYFFYFNENCARQNCNNPHFVNEVTFTKKCKELLSPEELKTVYNFTLRFHLLFQDMYPCLLKGFGYHNMQNNLFACIDDFFSLKEKINIDKAMKNVLSALQDTGLTFLEAVESISFNVGFMRHPDLANIMLDFLTMENNISGNWEIIKRIICRSTNFISPQFFERILGKLLITTPINRELCKDIYNVVIKNGKTNLAQVDPQLLTPIKTLAEFGADKLSHCIDKHLSKERENYEKISKSLRFEPPPIVNDDSLDSDERRLFPNPIKTIERREVFSPDSASSSKSGASRFSHDPDIVQSTKQISPQRKAYQYIPQAINANVVSQHPPSSSITVTVANNLNLATNAPSNYPISNRIVKHTNNYSSLSPPVEINIFPERPIFGKFKFQKGFSFDDSLHHLLPYSREQQVTMNETDIVRLNEFITNSDGNGFLTLLDQYKGPSTLQHFITMSLADLKYCHEPYISFVELLENIETFEPSFRSNTLLKGVFEVIAFNLLFYFERRGNYPDARKVMEAFSDWDSLISSKQFALKKLTPMGCYIFLANLLSKARAFYYVYEILQSPDLKLLEPIDKWPLFYVKSSDLESRNMVLSDFFKFAYRYDVTVVCDMYRKFENIYQFDAHTYFNPMLENLINNDKTSSLKHFHTDIDIFYEKMDRNILRAFTIIMENQLSFENKMRLYELGCLKGIYMLYTGRESTVIVRTNMPDNELKLVLQFYFHKLSYQYEVNNNLRIVIKLPDGIVQSPQILQKCIRSVFDVNLSVRKILSEYFKLNIANVEHDNYTVIEVLKEELRKVIINV